MGSTRSCHRRQESRPRRQAGPGRPAHGNVRDLGRRAPPRGDDERDAVVPTSPLTSFTGSFTRNVRTRAESRTRPPSAPPKGWPTSVFVDATRCMIVGWQVASEMTVQTVLRALEVTCLRRDACHAGLSFSLDRAHSDAGREDRASGGHAPGRDRRGSLRRATGRATTPHAGERERLL